MALVICMSHVIHKKWLKSNGSYNSRPNTVTPVAIIFLDYTSYNHYVCVSLTAREVNQSVANSAPSWRNMSADSKQVE